MATDTITAIFKLTADFQTIQIIRRMLADEAQQTTLVSLLSDTLSVYLSQLIETDLTFQANLKVSKERLHPTGPRPPIPICKEGLLSWYDPDAERTNIVGRVGSSAFIEALLGHSFQSFRFISDRQISMTVYRRKDGKWYAAKRVARQLNRRYLGQPQNMTLDRLNNIAIDLASSDSIP